MNVCMQELRTNELSEEGRRREGREGGKENGGEEEGRGRRKGEGGREEGEKEEERRKEGKMK